MQRMIEPPRELPPCRSGHRARLIHDCRRASAGGGLLIECACGSTRKHDDFAGALAEWQRMQGCKVAAVSTATLASIVRAKSC